MFLVATAIIIIVCIYSVLTHTGKTLFAISTMPLKRNPGSDAKQAMEITNDSSDILTEQSSLSDFTVNTDNEEDSQLGSEMESQKETPEYTEIEIEDPPSFLNSQYSGSSRNIKCYFQRVPTAQEDDADLDGVFQKKVNKPSGPRDDEPCSSSGDSRSNRKPRKPRVRNNLKKNTNQSGNTISNWRQKQGDHVDRNSTKTGTGKDGLLNSGNDLGETAQADDGENPSDSACSTATTNSEEKRGKKRLKHVNICLDEETAPVPKVVHEKLQIAGVNVQFPVKPYPSQIAVMNKLIQGCKKEEHCLLESPTGSGKTLALLCGVLAWQDHQQEFCDYSVDEIRKQNEELLQRSREHFETKYGIDAGGAAMCIPPNAPEARNDEPSPCCARTECKNPDEYIEFSEDEDKQPASKKFCQSTSPAPLGEAEKSDFTEPPFFEDPEEFFSDKIKLQKTPTIYYGSRTHKQIEQVIRELKKTAYAFKTMTILSSREFTCIQNTDRNKTEECTNRLDPTVGKGCQYYNESNRGKMSSPMALKRFGIQGPWDIEDLVAIGRQQSVCPYFAARDLMEHAEIVFCPYNYLVDPNIRQSMQINLAGQVVILDEAHNIEEMSREVGSLSFREDKIADVIKEAELLCVRRKHDRHTYFTVQMYLQNFVQFLKTNSLNEVDKFSNTSSSEFWTGVQLAELFNIHSLGKAPAQQFKAAAGAAILDFNTAKEENAKKQQSREVPEPVITPIAKKFLEDLMLALQMMTSETLANDYRACIIETQVNDYNQDASNWIHRGAPSVKRLRSLQMLCMNPAVIFAPLANLARSVVLASGTLSPISSFQSELGTVFPHKLDANHVVPKESVYIRGIPCGPTGVQLKANYVNVNSYNFQDELGRLVLTVCKAVPHGVLCFFSSYTMMQKQIDRWKHNSCWDHLEAIKHVLQEPRGSSNLELVMQEFREIIRCTSDGPKDGITGALLLAVFRGKVAEGIDFSDNETRCVMAVGIPYAVRKDPSVDMKFNYNNLHQTKGLLKGGEWYAVQAFRALNQALGRCVRHRNDWGAVLLVDQRFLERANYNYLPKWVKTMWRDSVRFNLTQELEEFVASQIERTNKAKSEPTGS